MTNSKASSISAHPNNRQSQGSPSHNHRQQSQSDLSHHHQSQNDPSHHQSPSGPSHNQSQVGPAHHSHPSQSGPNQHQSQSSPSRHQSGPGPSHTAYQSRALLKKRSRKKRTVIPVIEEIPHEPHEMIREIFSSHRLAKRRIHELDSMNSNNNQIVLFFVGSKDQRGKIWHNDCNQVDRAVTFLIKKLQVGGNFLKIYVGERSEWMDPENPWRMDAHYKITNLPTLMVCNTFKRLNGRKCFDMESLITLLKD